jgi:hypothetical protein
MATLPVPPLSADARPASTQNPLDDALRQWTGRAAVLISDRLADARAHAEAGRWADAEHRLDELRKRLLDDQSGAGSLLSNARAAFYRSAFHLEPFDPAIHADGIHPEPAGELAARFASIGGVNQYIEARQVLERARESLKHLAALRQGNLPTEGSAQFWSAQFDGWLRRHRDAITSHISGALSDAQISLSEAVSQIRIKPELR